VRWVVRGKDAGSVRIGWIRTRLRTPHRTAQRGPAAQRLLLQALLVVGHGGTAGLIVEITTAVAIGGLLVWAAIKSRRDHDEGSR
jgi:hypothetical protein